MAEEGVKEYAPLLLAVVVPKVEESIKSVTLELASALPIKVGCELLVTEEVVARVGTFGAIVSIAIDREDLEEVLSAESVALVAKEYEPSSRGDVTVIEKLPLLSAVAVPKTLPSLLFIRVTVEPASAIPVIVGVELLVIESLTREVGAFGAVVSIVMGREDLEEVLFAESVALAFIEYAPSSRGDVTVIEKLPLLSAVAVPKHFHHYCLSE